MLTLFASREPSDCCLSHNTMRRSDCRFEGVGGWPLSFVGIGDLCVPLDQSSSSGI